MCIYIYDYICASNINHQRLAVKHFTKDSKGTFTKVLRLQCLPNEARGKLASIASLHERYWGRHGEVCESCTFWHVPTISDRQLTCRKHTQTLVMSYPSKILVLDQFISFKIIAFCQKVPPPPQHNPETKHILYKYFQIMSTPKKVLKRTI